MHGYGEFLWKDGNKYFGHYVSDKKEGFGVFFWPGIIKFYIGFWKNGNILMEMKTANTIC